MFGRHIGGIQRRGRRDHHAPAGAGICAGGGLGHLDNLARAELQPAKGFRRHHAERARGGELCGEVCRKAAGLFHLAGTRSEFRQERRQLVKRCRHGSVLLAGGGIDGDAFLDGFKDADGLHVRRIYRQRII